MNDAKKKFFGVQQVFDCALNFLASRDYSSAEIEEKLLSKGATEEQAREVSAKLRASGLINDLRYAGRVYECWLAKGNYGRLYLKAELQKRKLAPDVREEVLKGVSDQQEELHAEKAAEIFIRRNRKKIICGSADKRKLSGAAARFLAVRGFPSGYMELLMDKIHRTEELWRNNLDNCEDFN